MPIFNIYAQSGTGYKNNITPKSSITVMGKGTRPASLKVLQSRAQKKAITYRLMPSLMEIALKKGEIERYDSYKNTFYCQSQIYTANGRLYGTYCKNRFCEICLTKRRADKVSKYLPIIKTYPDPRFLTLTLVTIPADRLSERINEMFVAFETIKDKFKKRHQRGKGFKLMGVRSLESNFNGVDRKYNPHFHCILPSYQMADTLRTEWINYWGDYAVCNPGGQDNKRIENIEWQLRETIKYGTKYLSRRKRDRKTGKLLPPFIYLAAIDNIFCTMKKHRLFDRFGFNLPESEKPEGIFTSLTEYREWNYNAESYDWIADDNGQVISGYIPPPKLTTIFDTYVNTEIE